MRCLAKLTRVLGLSVALMVLAGGGSVRADLVGFWNFDDETADDLSGNGNDGEIDGPEFSDDVPFGTGKSLDVFGGTVRIPHSDSLGMADTMTIAFWMKAENLDQPSNWNGPMGKISDPREAGGWEMQRWEDSSRIDIRIDTSDGANSVRGNLTGTFDDEWVHVAWTVDSGEYTSFLDGEVIDVGSYPHGDGFANESDLFFGNRGNCCQYIGLLDEIGIWNNVLSDDEIADLAAGKSPIDPGPGIVGDFNGNGQLDEPDVNMLSTEIAAGTNEMSFDLTGDGVVNADDLTNWVKDQRKTWFGDANLDSEFGSGDLVQVFQAGKFEVDTPATWGEGDWNADGRFGSGDLVSAFQDGGFELGPPPAANAVPEPASLLPWTLGLLSLAIRRRRRCP